MSLIETTTSAESWRQRLDVARAEHAAGGGSVLDVLMRHQRAPKEALASALAVQAGVSIVDTARDWQALPCDWNETDASLHQCIVLRSGADIVAVAADPWDEALARRLALAFGREIDLQAGPGTWIDQWLIALPRPEASAPQVSIDADGPVVSFVNAAIRHGIAVGASDIHFECDRSGLSVKHRLDGVLQPFARFDDVAGAEAAISRLKVLSQLDITERRLPQDGRFRHEMDNDGAMDMRVSIMPSVHGEDAVLRLLDKRRFHAAAGFTLDALGFPAEDRAAVRSLALLPSGMLLVTGPTGSGKTTTLYAVLSEIRNGTEKIITIEDPVEYELEGVLQIPVNERKGLTFARGLRSILRHDPDRILVGEIRDAETAEIAVQASLTGHQVFTTVHANSLSDVMGRFLHFDLDMFGFTSALNGIVVQRLLRKTCPKCSQWAPPKAEDAAQFEASGVPVPERLKMPQGCSACSNTGYQGRFVLAEVHTLDDELRDLVLRRASITELKRQSRASGVRPLLARGLDAAARGETTLAEIRRVIGGA